MENFNKIRTIFLEILNENLSKGNYDWINTKLTEIKSKYSNAILFNSFSSSFKNIENKILIITELNQMKLKKINPNFDISHWNTLILARVIFLQHIDNQSFETFKNPFYMIFDSADAKEQEALYASFAYLPFQSELSHKFSLGISTNISSVFDFLAFKNPYPFQCLSELSWNQLVIKAIFNDKNIKNIIGLNQRLNPELSRMAKDLKSERQAANRIISDDIELLIPN